MFLSRWWRNIRTAIDLADRVNAVEEAMNDIEMEWVDKREAFTLLVKRLATRAARASVPADEPPPEPVSDAPPPDGRKEMLRQIARQRGFRV